MLIKKKINTRFNPVLVIILKKSWLKYSSLHSSAIGLVTDIEVIAIALESLHRWWNWNGHCNRIDILDMQTNSRCWILRWVNNIPTKTNNHVVCWLTFTFAMFGCIPTLAFVALARSVTLFAVFAAVCCWKTWGAWCREMQYTYTVAAQNAVYIS